MWSVTLWGIVVAHDGTEVTWFGRPASTPAPAFVESLEHLAEVHLVTARAHSTAGMSLPVSARLAPSRSPVFGHWPTRGPVQQFDL